MSLKSFLCLVCCLASFPVLTLGNEVAPLTPKQQMAAHTADLRALMLTLYGSYPAELAKSTKVSPREFTEWVFEGKANWKFEAVRRLQGEAALALWDDPDYQSDLILPMIIGLETLLFQAYGAENEFQIPDKASLDQLQRATCALRAFVYTLPAQSNKVRLKHLFAHQAGVAQIQMTLASVINRIEAQNTVDASKCIQD